MPAKINLPVTNLELKTAYENGYTTYELAKKYNVSHVTIGERLKSVGCKIRRGCTKKSKKRISIAQRGIKRETVGHKNGMYKEIPTDICKMYTSGESAKEIAEKYNCSRPTIISKLKELGVKIRTNKESLKNLHKNKPDVAKRISDTLKDRCKNPCVRKQMSAAYQGVSINEWDGFVGRHANRPHALSSDLCIRLNEPFAGCEGHHLSRSLLVYIPKVLHNHIRHNLKTGKGMASINAIAIQYLHSD